MFSTSTHRKYWMFANEKEVVKRRNQVHEAFIEKFSRGQEFLTEEEADGLVNFFQSKLIEFCVKFKPPMPHGVQGTAVMYYKRFYLNNSPMDYHPKEIL